MVEKIANGIDIITNEEDDIIVSSISSSYSKDSDSENVNLEAHSEESLSSNSKRSKGIKIQAKDIVCTFGKMRKRKEISSSRKLIYEASLCSRNHRTPGLFGSYFPKNKQALLKNKLMRHYRS